MNGNRNLFERHKEGNSSGREHKDKGGLKKKFCFKDLLILERDRARAHARAGGGRDRRRKKEF